MTPAARPDRANADLCAECGGVCCWLYLAYDEDGRYAGDEWLPAYIAEWLGRFEDAGTLVRLGDGPDARYVAGEHGVEPLHDPRLSHLPTPEGAEYRATLPAWVDTRMCQFCHPETGCLLPREWRTPLCNAWVCDRWEDAPS